MAGGPPGVQVDNTTMMVTELPIRKWTQDYKEFLEVLIKPEAASEAPMLADFRDNSTEADIRMTLQFASAAKAQVQRFDVVWKGLFCRSVCCGLCSSATSWREFDVSAYCMISDHLMPPCLLSGVQEVFQASVHTKLKLQTKMSEGGFVALRSCDAFTVVRRM